MTRERFRYALLDRPLAKQTTVHRTDGDETDLTLCGVVGASRRQRYSRRNVKDLAAYDHQYDCWNCRRVVQRRGAYA